MNDAELYRLHYGSLCNFLKKELDLFPQYEWDDPDCIDDKDDYKIWATNVFDTLTNEDNIMTFKTISILDLTDEIFIKLLFNDNFKLLKNESVKWFWISLLYKTE